MNKYIYEKLKEYVNECKDKDVDIQALYPYITCICL